MKVLHWIGGIIVSFWLIGIIFKVGGSFLNILLMAAAAIFIYDVVVNLRNEKKNKI